MSDPLQDPELLERERASDVPEGAHTRADGSFIDAEATEEQAKLREQEVDGASADQAQRDELSRETGQQAELPREQGTQVVGGAE